MFAQKRHSKLCQYKLALIYASKCVNSPANIPISSRKDLTKLNKFACLKYTASCAYRFINLTIRQTLKKPNLPYPTFNASFTPIYLTNLVLIFESS